MTVEPEGAPPPSPVPARGSFFATIHKGSTLTGAHVLYTIRRSGALDSGEIDPVQVPRHRLRIRQWYTTAFVGITNEKKHDGWTSQANLNWQLNFWRDRSGGADRALDAASASSAHPSSTQPSSSAAQPSSTAAQPSSATEGLITAGEDAAACVRAPRSLVRVPSAAVEARRLSEWREHRAENTFDTWVGHSDNASHFKSGKMMHYWSKRTTEVDFLQHAWVYFGCPGHGKGPWDGFGATIKQKNGRTTKNLTFKTTSGEMKTSMDVAGSAKPTPPAPPIH